MTKLYLVTTKKIGKHVKGVSTSRKGASKLLHQIKPAKYVIELTIRGSVRKKRRK